VHVVGDQAANDFLSVAVDDCGEVDESLPGCVGRAHPVPGLRLFEVRTDRGRIRWTIRWKPTLKAFSITFQTRWPAVETTENTALKHNPQFRLIEFIGTTGGALTALVGGVSAAVFQASQA